MKGNTKMTQQEIINFIEQIIKTNPKTFSPGDSPIIEDNYIDLPPVEFRRDSNTDEWIPV